MLKEEELRTIPDDKLASVIMANLLAKMDKKHPDPYVTIPPLGEARCTVYCVWLFDRILQEDGAASLRRGREVKLLDFAVEGFRTVGAPAVPRRWRRSLTAIPRPNKRSGRIWPPPQRKSPPRH